MNRKSVVIGLIIGVAIGAVGSYYSFYALMLMEFEVFPSDLQEEQSKNVVSESLIPKTLYTDELKYMLIDTKRTDFGVNGEKPLEGGIFLITKIEIENLTKEEIIVYGKNWFIKDDEDRIFKPQSFNAEIDDENVFNIRIPPGFTVVKNIGFEIPSELETGMEMYVSDGGFISNPILLGRL